MLESEIIGIKEGHTNMADRDELAGLAGQAAEALLKAITSAAPKSQSTDGVLHLAQAYALVVAPSRARRHSLRFRRGS